MKGSTYSIEKLATLLNGKIKREGCTTVSGIAPFFQAKEGELTFAADIKYLKKLDQTKASVVLVPPLPFYPKGRTYIVVSGNPRELMPKLLSFFKRPVQKITKSIEDSAHIDESVTLAPGVYIGHDVTIGKNTIIHPNVVIYEGASIGENCEIFAGAVIREFCNIGNNCILQPGAVIGSDGFGYVPIDGKNVKIEQIGAVILEDNVEVGANTTIDRGAIGNTLVKENTKIDNLVQLGHNNIIGKNCIIVSQVGIAGSTEVGDNCTLAGQVGVAGHLKIGDNVMIGAKSGIHGDIEENQAVMGIPVLPIKETLKIRAILKKLPELAKTVKQLEKKTKKLK